MNTLNVIGKIASSYWIKIKKSRDHRKVGLRTGNRPSAMRIVAWERVGAGNCSWN